MLMLHVENQSLLCTYEFHLGIMIHSWVNNGKNLRDFYGNYLISFKAMINAIVANEYVDLISKSKNFMNWMQRV